MPARAPQPGEAILSASGKLSTFGYHNTFSHHASSTPVSSPPSYENVVRRDGSSSPRHNEGHESLPGYTCEVHFEGFLDMRTEHASPFLVSLDNSWHTVYVVLHGTQLSIYRLKSSLFRSRPAKPGRLLRTYSLQHSEIGIAADWQKGELIPRATFAKVLPRPAQLRLWETDPDLFEPMREWVFRMRLETEQLIFCATSHEDMLDWIEEICMGIDISPPIDDRNEPKFRSLPRRTRRQRQIEHAAQMAGLPFDREELERHFIEEQERIFRRLYPNLAASSSDDRVPSRVLSRTEQRPAEARDDNEEFDREDAQDELSHANDAADEGRETETPVSFEEVPEPYDPKTAVPRGPMSLNAWNRFRRRCAPILLASSQRSSNVIFHDGGRYIVDSRRCQLIPFLDKRPPRYEGHATPPSCNAISSSDVQLIQLDQAACERRPSLARGISEASTVSTWSHANGDEEEVEENSSLHTTTSQYSSSHEELDRIDTIASLPDDSPDLNKAKSRIILVQQGLKMTNLKPLPSSYDDLENAMSISAHVPVLI